MSNKPKISEEKCNFRTHFSHSAEFAEKTSLTSAVIPGQSVTLSELVRRFVKGQRLNIHINPSNEFYPEEEVEKHSERFEDAPPDDIQDIVDVERFNDELQARKAELRERQAARKKAQAQQAQQAQAQPAQPAQPKDVTA